MRSTIVLFCWAEFHEMWENLHIRGRPCEKSKIETTRIKKNSNVKNYNENIWPLVTNISSRNSSTIKTKHSKNFVGVAITNHFTIINFWNGKEIIMISSKYCIQRKIVRNLFEYCNTILLEPTHKWNLTRLTTRQFIDTTVKWARSVLLWWCLLKKTAS